MMAAPQPSSILVNRSANFPSGDLSLMLSFASSDGARQLAIRMTATADIVFTAFVSRDTSASKHSFCFVWVALINLKIHGSSFIADHLSEFRRLGNVKSASLENIRRGFAAE